MKIHTRMLALALVVSLLGGLAARPALAVDEATNPAPATHAMRCAGSDCTVKIDLGGWQVPLLWRYGAPLLVDNLQAQGRLPAGATLAIADDLTLALPIGDLQLLDADLQVKLNADQTVESFRGVARVPFPAIGFLENLRGADPLHADVGFDYGANLTAIDAPLDPATRYFFFDFGSGVRLDGAVTGADGSAQQVSLATPHGQRAVMVIDPLRPLVFVQGQLTLNHTGSLAFIDSALAANGIDAPGVDFAALPARTSVGVTALLSDDPTLAYLEVSTGAAIDGGLLARGVGIDATPIAIDGVARLDHTGLRVTGTTRSTFLPATVWDGRGEVEVFLPFDGGLHDAYVAAGGAASVPLAQLHTTGATRLALPPSAAAPVLTVAEQHRPGWWARTTGATGAWIGRTGEAMASAGGAVGAGAGAAWEATATTSAAFGGHVAAGATSIWHGTTCALSFVPGVTCADEHTADTIASR